MVTEEPSTAIRLHAPAPPGEPLDTQALRGVYARFPTGVMAVCALRDGDPIGFAASSFNTISLDPPLVVVSVQSGSQTWPRLAESPRIGLSVLASDQGELCRRLAGRPFDRFVGAPWVATEEGAVLVEGAAAWLECDIAKEVTVGDHEMAILRVRRMATNGEKHPLVFSDGQFHQLAQP